MSVKMKSFPCRTPVFLLRTSLFVFAFLILSSTTAFSQKLQHKRDTSKGFDFFFNAGMYLGSKANANYYRGWKNIESDYADPDINYVLNNQYWYRYILDAIDITYNDVIADTFFLEGTSEMKYNMAFVFGIGARYRFSENFMLSFLFSQVRLTAEGIATLAIKGTGVNLDKGIKYIDYPLIGKERRNFFEMNAAFLFNTASPYIYPFVELGVHVNSTKVLSSVLIVEEQSYSLINWHGEGTQLDPSITLPEIDPHLGGIGYGFMGGFGVRLTFNKWAAIEPVVQINAEKVQLAGYNEMRPNFNFMVRLVVGDQLFSKKQ
jgi:hypothetical protein